MQVQVLFPPYRGLHVMRPFVVYNHYQSNILMISEDTKASYEYFRSFADAVALSDGCVSVAV